jgi:hypothetical protein
MNASFSAINLLELLLFLSLKTPITRYTDVSCVLLLETVIDYS